MFSPPDAGKPVAAPTKKPKSNRLMDILADVPTRPVFTDAELRAIHRDLATSAWQREEFYDERRAILKKLDAFFGGRPK